MEVSGLIRAVQSEGGFGTVLQSGEREAGTILVVALKNGATSCLYERMPNLDGNRAWSLSKRQDPENKREFEDYLTRRGQQDPDCWLIELDIANAERFIGLSGTAS